MTVMFDYEYIGSELELFAEARNWKSYFASKIRGYLKGDVLEVGAGLGANTGFLRTSAIRRWLCLEPDRDMFRLLADEMAGRPSVEVLEGRLENVPRGNPFDAILYLDVLEHIADDSKEVCVAADMLRHGGVLIVLAPAHRWLFSEFDSAIGHFRRYNKKTLIALQPPSLKLEKLIYLDSVGLLASLGNRFLMRRPLPTLKQVLLWDNWLVPTSRLVDRFTGHSLGKSILAVWRRQTYERVSPSRRDRLWKGSFCSVTLVSPIVYPLDLLVSPGESVGQHHHDLGARHKTHHPATASAQSPGDRLVVGASMSLFGFKEHTPCFGQP